MIVGGWSLPCSLTCTVNDLRQRLVRICDLDVHRVVAKLRAVVGVQETRPVAALMVIPAGMRCDQAVSQWIAGGIRGDGLVKIHAAELDGRRRRRRPCKSAGSRVRE